MNANPSMEFQYWLIENRINDSLERTLCKTGVWQTKPFGAVEITEEEYLSFQKKH